MKKMESSKEKQEAVAMLIKRMNESGLNDSQIARAARITQAGVWQVRKNGTVPRWATIDKINRGLNRWESSK